MTDLTLNIRGDSSSAQQAFKSVGDAAEASSQRQRLATKQAQDDDVRRWEMAGAAAKKASDDAAAAHAANKYAWEQLGKYVAAAGTAMAAFAIHAVKAYADSEKGTRQLERATGEYAGMLDKQAQALLRVYAVDDDIIKQSMTMLAQWGGAGAAMGDVEKAALNLSSAMGISLAQATEELIRNVESGGTGLGKMGIHFKVTGDKGKDLASAVAAINKQLGGAAAADADSLTGQTHAASLAFGDLEKSFGGSLAKFIKGTGVLDALTKKMRDLQGLFTPAADKQAEDKGFIQQQVNYWDAIASGNITGWKDAEAGIKFTFEEAQAELTKWRAKLNPENFNDSIGGAPSVGGKTNKASKEAEAEAQQNAKNAFENAKKNSEDLRKLMREEQEFKDTNLQKDMERADAEFSVDDKLVKDQIKSGDEQIAQMMLHIDKENELYEKQIKYRDAAAAKMLKEANDSNAEAMKAQSKKWEEAGAAIGNAFTSALSTQLAQLAAGGEFDAAIFVGDILAATISIAATVIGSAYGQPELGAAIGNLAAMGVRAGASAISADNKKSKTIAKKYHQGGEIGDEIDIPRYHSGGALAPDEMHIIAQKGEHMLSRRDVANMGGHAGVEAAKGRGGSTIINNIQALDAKSAAEGFMGSIGKGLKDALRTGRGDLPNILKVNPR